MLESTILPPDYVEPIMLSRLGEGMETRKKR